METLPAYRIIVFRSSRYSPCPKGMHVNAAIDIVHRIRAVVPQFDREVAAKRAAVRRKKAVTTDQQLLLQLEGIPPDILEAVAKELKL